MKNNKSQNVLILIVISVIFGLGSGIAGGLITRSYLMNDIYSVPFYGKINYSTDNLRRANLIIENAKNITVEQDAKINETINSASRGIIGIFKKINTGNGSEAEFDPNDHYQMDEEVAEGLVVTSDGWILLSDFGEILTKEAILNNYVAISKDKKIFEIDEMVREKGNNFLFLHLKDARDLPVRQFSFKENLNNGQLVIAVDWDKNSFLTYVIGREDDDSLVRSSDISSDKVVFSDDLSNYFERAFIFNLNGDLIALLDKKGQMKFVNSFDPAVKNLLSKEDKSRASLGVNYVELSELAIEDNSRYSRGALIYPDASGVAVVKGSVAEEAGLKQGDIILSVDNMEINKENDLTDIIQRYAAGDEVSLNIYKDGQEQRIEVILKELK
ncbi:PDZ domain-containing protein [Candidatus Falkowbacteria bacterium]|nr:PDZ domain-containing protein [Candidatus Falkowbacteria bacterium]